MNVAFKMNGNDKYFKRIPKRVYKYFEIDANLKNTLKENYLWLSNCSNFNDPYDCYFNLLDIRPTEENLLKHILHGQEKNAHIIEAYKDYIRDKPEELKAVFKIALEPLIYQRGICCFSRSFDNLLLWSHYTAKHKGICLGFDPTVDPETFIIVNVNYIKEFTAKDYHSEEEDALIFLFATKSKHWQYEKEMRILKPFTGRLPFKKHALKEVIFGCKINHRDLNEVIQIVKGAGYEDVTFKRAQMKDNSFALDFIKIK